MDKNNQTTTEVKQEKAETPPIAKSNNNTEITPKTANKRQSNKISKNQLDESYKKIMSTTQSELPAPRRIFSKFLHNRFIETVSNIIGSTLARPSSIFLGSLFAFVFTVFIYVVSKRIGYALSGSETIVSFALGWFAGAIYDYIKLLIVGKS